MVSIENVLDEKGCFKLNPFFRIQLRQPIVIELLLENKYFALPNKEYLKYISGISQKREYSLKCLVDHAVQTFNVSAETAKEIIEDLFENKILVQADYTHKDLPAVKHWAARGWLDALVFHLKSRNLDFSDDNIPEPDVFSSSEMKKQIEEKGPPHFWKNVGGKRFLLKTPTEFESDRFQEVLLRRRSHSKWRGTGVREQEISNILYYGNIETVRLRKAAEENWEKNPGILLNSAFSALETYFFAFNMDNLEPGLYHYDPKNHLVTLLKSGLLREEVSKMCIGQQRPGQSDCAIVITAIWERYMYRYKHPRAYRTLLINVAELAQKYITLSTAMNLSTFLTPALEDQYADNLLGVDGYEEAPLYVVAIG